jgi:signal transduction histidine kinase
MQVDAGTGGYLYQVHDLTEQKQAAVQLAELAAQRTKLEASELAHRAKREFMSRASHEMRTPLNAVMGFAQLLQMQTQADLTQTALYGAQILQAGQRLLALVDDLLDIQRATQGINTPVLTRVELGTAAEEMRLFLHDDAKAAQVGIKVQLPVGLHVMADPTRLRQVLRNLGSNAVKFNRPGGSVVLRAQAAVAGEVLLQIKDSGIGMAPAQMAQLFEPFDRLGRERSTAPGVGLGLLLARSLVLEMGGRLEVFSEVDRGTVLTVALRPA